MNWVAYPAEGELPPSLHYEHSYFSGAAAIFYGKGEGSNAEVAEAVLSHRGLRCLMLPRQVHGREVWDLRGALPAQGVVRGPSADAVIVSRDCRGAAVGILTADCLPIMFVTEEEVAVVHAGWRGLACGVLESTLEKLSPSAYVQVLIGPAAGPLRYEVGSEVISALGQGAVATAQAQPGRYLLNLAATAEHRIRRWKGAANMQVTLSSAEICTIGDSRFHSYRRDAQSAGRNLSVLVLE